MTDLERLEEIERAGKSTESYENGCMQVSLLTQEFEFLLNYARRAIVAEAALDEVEAAARAYFDDDHNWFSMPQDLRDRQIVAMKRALQAAAVWRKAHEGEGA